jgi:phospholipid/cholesterol/gamma-HCH transport system ATP-binding protein
MGPSMTGLDLEGEDGDWRLRLSGDWSLAAMAQIEALLDGLPAALRGALTCDWSRAEAPGIGPVWVLLARLGDLGAQPSDVRHTGGPPHFLELLQKLEAQRHAVSGAPAQSPGLEGLIGKLGRWAVLQGRHARGVLGFFGRIVTVLGAAFSRPRALRLSSVTRHVYETGITAIPIVSLIAFLISVIVAYLGAQQLGRFGADIFVVDLVTISVLREMGVLLTAIIVAGRSGSAFAAEIGVMQLNEETDALRAMGMNPVELLVVPRVLALMISLGRTVVAGQPAHPAAAVHQSAARIAVAHDLLVGPDQGAGIRHADRNGRHLPRHAGARFGARAGTLDHGGRRAIDLSRHSGRRLVRDPVRADRLLMPDGAATAVIRVRGLVSRFGAQVVHDGLDMEVRSNEIFGVVGGSGAGKTVLLRTILGLRAPDGGSVELYGKDVQQLAAADLSSLVRSYGVTFQNGALISSLSVAQNIQLPLREYDPASERTLGELADLNLALVGLEPDDGAKYPSQLSGGMVKRAALARALSLEPKLLFLDEPTAGLDPISAAAFDELLLYLHSQLRLTVVMITHDLDTLFRTCSRVGVIVDGRMITDSLDGLLQNQNPWIHSYFHGPRARAAEKETHG